MISEAYVPNPVLGGLVDGCMTDYLTGAASFDDCYTKLEDLPKKTLEQIEFHFNHYKDLKKPGTTKVKGFEDVKSAKKVIADAIERFLVANPDVKMQKDAEKFVAETGAKLNEVADKIKKAWTEE